MEETPQVPLPAKQEEKPAEKLKPQRKPFKPPLPLIISSILCLVFIFSTINLFLGKKEEREKRFALQLKLEQTLKNKEELEQQLSEATNIKQELEVKLDILTKEAEILNREVATERQGKRSLSIELGKVKEEIREVQARLEQEKQEKASLAERLAQWQKSYQDTLAQLNKIKSEKEALELKAAQGEDKNVSLDKIVLKGGVVADGRVLVVNKEYNFVVINLGAKDGIKVGTNLLVYRDEKVVGKIEVEKLYETMSSATILPETKNDLKEGDSVKVI